MTTLLPLTNPANLAEGVLSELVDLSLMPAASPAPPQMSLPDASSSLFGLLLEAELPEGEEARSGMQAAGDGDSESKEPQVLPWWPGFTALGAAQSIAPALPQTATATSNEARLVQPAEEIRVGQTAIVEPAMSSSAPSERRAGEVPQMDPSAGVVSLAPAKAVVPAAGLGFSPGRPSSTDDTPPSMAAEAVEGKLEAGPPELTDPAAAQADEARRNEAEPEPNRLLVGSQGQVPEGGRGDQPRFSLSVSAGDGAVGNKLKLPSPESRGGEVGLPASNSRQLSPALQEPAHATGLAPAVQMRRQDSVQTGSPAAEHTEAGVENVPRNAGRRVRPDPASSVLIRSAATNADSVPAGQTERGLTKSEGLELTAQRAAGGAALPALPPEAPHTGQVARQDRLADAGAAADPQPMQAPVVTDAPRRSSAAAGEPERQAMQEPEQPMVRPNQAAAEPLGQTAAVLSGIHTGPVSSNAVVRSGPVLLEIAPLPNPDPTAGGSSTPTASNRWSGLPERAVSAPLWGSEVAFAAKLTKPSETATLSPDARSMSMPGARQPVEPDARQALNLVTPGAPARGVESPGRAEMSAHETSQELGRAQAKELLGNDRRAQSPGESPVETRAGLAEEPAPAPRRPVAYAGAAVELQPPGAASRLAAEWSAATTAHRQDPAAESGHAGGTQARTLREAVAGADPAERLVQGQPGGTVRELRVRVAEAGVEVRLSPAARELHVAVRSPQPELREALRSGLDELASRLAERGLEAQIWRPSNSSATSGAAERGWEALRAQFAESGDPGAGRRGQPDQQPSGDQQRRHPDPRWGEAWSELEGEAAPPVWRLRR